MKLNMNTQIKKPKAAVAMSGGVDSSTVAALLKGQGYGVVGIFMQNWTEPGCRTPEDRADAVKVASHLNIPFEVWDFEKEYREKVIEYFYREYEAGRTPNPDVMCNKEIKFKLFFDRAFEELDVDYIATGHYAISKDGKLYEGSDPKKDQSYFLCQLTQYHLEKTLFPLGELTKPEVRQLAQDFKLPVAAKPDSQGICFVGEVNIKDFLKKRIKPSSGKIITVDGQIVGEHEGAAFYTVGQRHGFNVGGGIPYYVAGKDTSTNTLYVSKLNDDRFLYTKVVIGEELHWINPSSPPEEQPKDLGRVNDRIENAPLDSSRSLPFRMTKGQKVFARIRYQQPKQEALLSHLEGRQVVFTFKELQRAATPGQSVVFYSGEGQVLGAAIISEDTSQLKTSVVNLQPTKFVIASV